MAVATSTTSKKITKDDIEAKLREIAGDIDVQVDRAKPKLISGAVGLAVLALLVAYLLGRRGGKSKSAVVEIRRI